MFCGASHRPRNDQINPEGVFFMKYCFGVDIGGTFVKLGLFTTEGELLDKWQIPTRREDASSHVLPDIAASIAAKMEEKGINKDDVTGVGFGTPGPVTDDGVAVCPANLDWVNKPVAKEDMLAYPSIVISSTKITNGIGYGSNSSDILDKRDSV